MPRTKKPTNDFAVAAAALADLNKLDNAAPAERRCPAGMTLDPYRNLVPVKPRLKTLAAMIAKDRDSRPPAVITLPPVTIITIADDDITLTDDHWEQVRAERAFLAHRKPG